MRIKKINENALIRNRPHMIFAFAAMILLFVGVIVAKNLDTLIETGKQVDHTLIVLTTIEETLALVVDAETGQRGYIITGDERYLEPYFAALAPQSGVFFHIQRLRELTVDNTTQQAHLDTLDLLVVEKFAFIEETIELRKNVGFETAQESVLTYQGINIMDEIRQLITEMRVEENSLLLERSNSEIRSLQNTLIVLVFGAVTSVSLIGLSFSLVNREVNDRRRTEKALQQLNDELERRVQERTVELSKVNDHLKLEIIQHQRTEQTLQESEKRLRTTLDTMMEGCQLISMDWRYLYLNDAAIVQGRKTREELLDHTMMEAYPGIENTEMFALLRRCAEERSSHQLENKFTFPDGSNGWFELSIQPVPEGIFILSQDITERKRAEEQIEQQLHRLQSLRAIDMAILGTTDLKLALKTVLEEAKARLQADIVQVELFNPHTLMLETGAVIGNHKRDIEKVAVRLGEGVGGKAALERHTIRVPNLKETALSGSLITALQDEGAQAIYSTPLIARGVLVGVLNVILSIPFDAPQDWLNFFETLAGQAAMAIESAKAFENLQRANLDLRLAYDTTIQGWSNALDLRDKETEGHTLRVTEMTIKLARIAGISEEELIHVRRGALLHDIGKMGIPDDILLKPDKLTNHEWEIMRKHPIYAYELLSPIPYLHPALDIPYGHHEKWDGSGYPRGLKGEQIPMSARLFAVVDVWDALRSDRPYRQGWEEDKVLAYIRSQAGTHFDFQAVELFLQLWEESKNGKR